MKAKGVWTAAITVAGIAAVGALVFLGLYEKVLSLRIFAALTQKQTFTIMLVCLALTFLAAAICVIAWVVDRRHNPPVPAPHDPAPKIVITRTRQIGSENKVEVARDGVVIDKNLQIGKKQSIEVKPDAGKTEDTT